ncbi:TPR-like protein [Gonapodya prolifera JEL478]|uniref:TPR-like protein n=1 Tax=Gonapodya prolifera (strain JEL478) TaxID=1344416 RepID=A0A139AM35_GONPJ|nr:TPR-like protein [Gonapodya prolifera JEL478]|eukprot:KXS17573.1 TPR-like protein [Gonapodya prolifera JEL478]
MMEQAERKNILCLATHHDLGDPHRAAISFSRPILLAPNEPTYYFHRAEALRDLGDMVASAANYRKALYLIESRKPPRGREESKHTVTSSDRPRFLERRLAGCLLEHGNKLVNADDKTQVHEGIRLLQQSWNCFAPSTPLISLTDGRYTVNVEVPTGPPLPKDVELWRQAVLSPLAHAYMKLSEYESAIEILYRLTFMSDTDVELWVMRSKAHKALGKTSLVKFDRDRIVQIDPSPHLIEHLTVYLVEQSVEHKNRADILSLQKELELSVISYTTALELDPDDTWSKLNRARVLHGLLKFEPALRDYESVLSSASPEVSPSLRVQVRAEMGAIHWKRARRALSRGDLPTALNEFDSAITNANEKEPRYFVDRAAARLAAGDKRGALADYAKAIELCEAQESTNPGSLSNLDAQAPPRAPDLIVPPAEVRTMRATCASFHLELAEHLIARCCFIEAALAFQPDNVECLIRRAVASISLTNVEAARADLEHALRLNPRHPEARSVLDNLAGESYDVVKAFPGRERRANKRQAKHKREGGARGKGGKEKQEKGQMVGTLSGTKILE